MRLTHTRLLVTRFDDCLRFYRDLLGLELIWGAEGGRYADFQGGQGSMLALFDRATMAAVVGREREPVDIPGQDRTMLIFEADDLDVVAARLASQGVMFISGPSDRPEWGIRAAHLRDPDGNLIELNCPLPKQEWTENLQQLDERNGE